MKKVIFVRVPRTASTNFTGVLEHIYKPKIIRDLVWQQMPARDRIKKLKKGEYFYDFDNMKYPAKNIRTYDAIEGHFLAKKYEALKDEYGFVTFLRNPIERVISHFNIIISRQDRLKLDIKKFAKIYKNLHKAMIGDINDFSFVGITEMFAFSTQMFYEKFEIPTNKRMNVKSRKRIRTVGKKRPVSKKERAFIREINAEDFEMYDHVRKQLTEIQQKRVKNRKEKLEKEKVKEKIEVKELSTNEQEKLRKKRIKRRIKRKKIAEEERRKRIRRKQRQAKRKGKGRTNGKAKNITDN